MRFLIDLAIIIVAIPGQPHWLEPCLRTIFANAGEVPLDVVVVDNGSEEARAIVESEFPAARIVSCENHGFAHANNRGLQTTDSRYVLFLNPDTEIVHGTLAELVERLDRQPDVGVAGVRQISADGTLHPTMRRFPSVSRALSDALGMERFSSRIGWSGERELDFARYETAFDMDWTSGSFMCVRREAIESAGFMDERFFLYAEEIDFCLRIRTTGWRVVHDPQMTIIHHVGKGVDARTADVRMTQQNAFALLQYARKNFGRSYREAYRFALIVRFGLRALPGGGSPGRRAASAAALRTVLGRGAPPFGPPPPQAVGIADWRRTTDPERLRSVR